MFWIKFAHSICIEIEGRFFAGQVEKCWASIIVLAYADIYTQWKKMNELWIKRVSTSFLVPNSDSFDENQSVLKSLRKFRYIFMGI